MKKIFALLTSVALSLSLLATSTFAANTQSTDTAGPDQEVVKSNNRGVVTVADIDALMGELSSAILNDDTMREHEVRAELQAFGATPVSFNEVLELTGIDTAPTPMRSVDIDFNTVYSDIIVGGETVEIMRIYATPQSGSNMYHEGTGDSHAAPDMRAGAVNAVKTWASFGTGFIPYVGTSLSIFDALRDTISGFTSSSIVRNVSIDYVFRCIENTTFLYFWNENSNNWSHIGTCSRLGTRVTTIIDEIKVENFAALPGGYSETYLDDIYANNYNNATYYYNYWWYEGTNFEHQADSFSISGAAGDDVEAVVERMVAPSIPALCS